MRVPKKKHPFISGITQYLIDSCIEEKKVIDKALKILSINSIYDYMYISVFGIVEQINLLYPNFNGDIENIDLVRLSKRMANKHILPNKKLSKEEGDIVNNGLTIVGKLIVNYNYHENKNESDYAKSEILIEKGIDEVISTGGGTEEERNAAKNNYFSTVRILKLHDDKLKKLKSNMRIETSKIRFIWIAGEKSIKMLFTLLSNYELIEKDSEKFRSLFIIDGKPLNNFEDKIIWSDEEASPTQIAYIFHKLCPDFIYGTQSKNINTIIKSRITDTGRNSTFLSNIDKLYSRSKKHSKKSEKIQQADSIIRALNDEYNRAIKHR